MKTIKLAQGLLMRVDDEDYPLLSRYKWWANYGVGRIYAHSFLGKRIIIAHRLIMACCKSEIVDHKDGDGLNNVKSNLRKCTYSQNGYNCKMQSHNTSGYRGVSFRKRDKIFVSRIKANGKSIDLGRFKTAEEAGKAYEKASIKYHGEFRYGA